MSIAAGQPMGRWWERIDPRGILVPFFCLLLLALSLQNRVVDADFWWHLRTGQWILEHRRIPLVDVYSYTAGGQRWIAHSWLADLGMYLLYRYVGAFILLPLRALLHVAAFALLLKLAWERWARFGGVLALVLVAFVASAKFWLTRPNSLSLALVIGLFYLWYQYKWRGHDRLWLLPPLMILWANLHSGYIFGFLLLGALFLGEGLTVLWPDPVPLDRRRWGRFGLFILLSIPAVLINPYGIHLWFYPFRYYLGGITLHTHFVGEWLSPNFHEPSNLLFALLIVALITAMAWRQRGLGPAETLALVIFVGLALRSVRAAGVAIPLLTGAVAGVLGQGVPPRAPASRRGAWPSPSKKIIWAWYGGALLLFLLLLTLVGFDYARWGRARGFLQEEACPRRAVEYLEQLPTASRLFNSYNWGGYLIWRLYPERLVFIDGRADLYGDEIFADYLQVWRLHPGWSQVLDRYDIGIVLCERQAPLATLLTESPSWNRIYHDETAALFRRAP